MSLIEMLVSASSQRWWKSRITASQIGPKPTAAVVISMVQAPARSAGSISTSRLPEPTTPTTCGVAFKRCVPCSNR